MFDARCRRAASALRGSGTGWDTNAHLPGHQIASAMGRTTRPLMVTCAASSSSAPTGPDDHDAVVPWSVTVLVETIDAERIACAFAGELQSLLCPPFRQARYEKLGVHMHAVVRHLPLAPRWAPRRRRQAYPSEPR